MMKVLEVAGCPSVPVAYGASEPQLFWGSDVPMVIRSNLNTYIFKCMGWNLRDIPASTYSGAELIGNLLSASNENVDLLILGPFTDVANALKQNREYVDKIGTVYFSGGNFDAPPPRNSSFPFEYKNKHTSWNVFCDALAASRIFESSIENFVLITSPAQNDLPMYMSHIDQFLEEKGWSDFRSSKMYQLHEGFGRCTNQTGADLCYWDQAAAVLMLQLQQGKSETICTK